MRKNRERIGLVAAILDAASNKGPSKTRIMFAANLSFKLLEKYLGVALNRGFIQVDGSNYGLTQRGEEFLSKFKSFQKKRFKVHTRLEELAQERAHLDRMCFGCPPNGGGTDKAEQVMV